MLAQDVVAVSHEIIDDGLPLLRFFLLLFEHELPDFRRHEDVLLVFDAQLAQLFGVHFCVTLGLEVLLQGPPFFLGLLGFFITPVDDLVAQKAEENSGAEAKKPVLLLRRLMLSQ